MSSFDDYRKKLQDKYGLSEKASEKEDEKSKTKTATKTANGSSFSDYRSKLMEKYSSKATYSDLENWFKEADTTLKSMQDYHKQNEGKFVTEYGGDSAQQIRDLMNSAGDIYSYLQNHKGEIGNYDEVSKVFAEYRNVLQQNQLYNYNTSRFYSQFASEDEYNKWYESNKKSEEYKSVLDAEDFEKYSYLGARAENPDWKDAHAPVSIFGWTPLGDGESIGNMVTFAEANGANAFASAGNALRGGGSSEYTEIVNLINAYMEEDEKKIYNYYIGKGDTEKASEYLAYMTDILRQRQGGVIAEQADGHWFAEPVLSGVAGFDQWVSGVENLDNFITGAEPDEDISSLNYAFQEMSGNNEGVWKVVNDLAHTTGNMAPSIIVGTLTGGIGGALTLGTSAVGNAYADMRRLGYDDGAAQNYAFLVGASEAALSYFLGGISKLGGGGNGIFQTVASKIVPKLDNAIARVAIQVGGNMLDEGLEEAIQEVLDPIFKMITTGEDFEGIDIEQVLYSGLLGALSAGILEGGPTIAGTAMQSNQARELYGGLTLGEGIQAFKENKKLSDVSKAFKEGKNTQAETASALVNEALEIDPENAHAQRMQARLEAGKDVSGYQINRLVEANEQTLRTQDKAKIKAAAEAELTKLGETGDVSKIADVITKIRAGEAITKAESKILTESKYGRRVSMTSNPEVIEQGGYDTAWAEKIGTERINAEAYNKGLYDLAMETAGVTADENIPSATNNTSTKEIAAESEFKASEDGKTRVGDMEISIKEIASVKNGKVVLRLDDDSTVEARDVDFGTADEVQLYETVADMGWNPIVANSFVNGYDGSIPVNNYSHGFQEAYRGGELGIPMAELSKGVFSAELTEAARKLAYDYGKADAKAKIDSKHAKIASVGANKAGENASSGKKKGKLHNTLKPTNETQRASLKTLGVLADTLGIDIYTFESKVVNGKRQGANGWYDPSDNSIHIDLFAGADGKGTMLFTAAHELTHHIREKLPAKFKAFADFLFEQYAEKGVSVSELIEAKKESLEKNGRTKGKTEAEIYDLAYEEVVADACESFLADGNAVAKIAELKAKNKTLWQTVKDFISNLVSRIKAAYEVLSPDSVEGRLVAEMLDSAEKLKTMWAEMVVEASEVETTTELLGENGVIVDSKTDSATLYSVRDVLSDADRKKVSKALAERFDVTQAEAMDWLKAETSLASLIINPKYSQHLDYTADPNEEAIKSNSDYPQGTVDFSNICKKRRDFTEVMNRVLRNFPNHVFAATDLAKIRTIMEQEGMEVACAICYVEDRRQLDSVVAQNFIDSLALYREGSKTKPDGTPFNANQLKAFSLIEGDTYTPSIYELISLEGRNSLKAKNPAMEEAWVKFNNARGMQSVRLLLNDAEYKRQILKYSQSVVKRKNDLGGLRIYSFSDMEMFHLIDIIQVITDSASVGLSLQGYTKVNEYAKAVKDTGEKLNRSLIPKGDLGYHMEGGKVVLDFDTTEGIDINHPDFFDNIDNPNIGNIVIGINATQIKAAMTSKFIDQIIPFHTGQSNEVLGEKGIAAWDNYKDFQSERDVKTNKKSSHQINIYTEVINAAEAEGKPITNKVEFVNKFLEVCRENNLIPRFSDFLNVDENGNYVYTEGYHKFLVDFKTFDQNTGAYLPQMPVKPVFDNAYITSLLTDYVKSQKVKDAEFAKAMPKVLDRITKEIVNPAGGAKYSDRYQSADTNSDILLMVEKVENGDFKENEKVNLGTVSDATAAEIYNITGINVTGFKVAIEARQINHILKDHGKNGMADRSMADPSDIAKIEFALEGYDDIRAAGKTQAYTHMVNGKNRTADTVLYEKAIGEKAYYVVQAVPDTKAKTLYIVTAFIGKKGYKKEASQLIDAKRPDATAKTGSVDTSTRSISQTDESVNSKYSDRDSDGNTLSAEQQEFFKDSKVRDENGNLLVLYHGTGTDFTEFDKAKIGENFGHISNLGFYFTPFDWDAKEYASNHGNNGRIMKVYLNLKNPLIVEDDGWGSAASQADVRHNDLMRWATQGGHDGIIVKSTDEEVEDGVFDTVYIAFNSNQIKSTSNKNPSDDSDIRYSDRDPDSFSNRSLLANALESVAQNDIERNKLSEYKAKIALIEAEQKKLAEVRAKIKELSFAKGPRDVEAIKKLQFTEKQTANRINTYDRQLLTLEATTALKGVLDREKKLAYKKAEQKGKDALAAYREKAAKTQRELLTRYQESRKKGIEGRKQTAMRLKVKNIVNELNQYLLNGTKEKHVPIGLQGVVAEALSVVNMDTVGAEERIAKLGAELRAAKSLEEMQKITKKIEHIREIGGNMEAKISRLKTAYDNLINSDDPLIANAHDDVISSSIEKVIEIVGDTPIRDMSVYQLEAVYDMYKMVLTSIRNTNKAFKAAKNAEISTIANGVISELMDQKRKTPYTSKAQQTMSEFDWNNLKPVYAFERIGSANFTTVFDAVREGEDVWATDMSEAQAFREEQFQKYKYDTWDFDKRFGFTSTSGMRFELSLDQIMSLYAFSKRDQAEDHLKYGGFVFDGLTEVKAKNKVGITVTYQLKDATAYNISKETLAEIIEALTPEQKAFVDVMQDYLSTVMGEKGNEVSLALYDIKLFKEKYYFPLKSAPQYLAKAKEQAMGEVKIKNSGFTKETTPKAKNPIVLSSFMDVWAGHVNDMSMYHAFTLPLEDFYRVYNYHSPADKQYEMVSVGASLENAHGQAAVNYIDQLLKDINGGARSDPRDSVGKALMANFKKASVMASLSVVIQQPSAIVRAQALVDAKYFVGVPSGKHRDHWAEVKKYAPVAIIKEMGYFDTGMGKSSVEWLKGEKTWRDKLDDATSKLPALADEFTWVSIWNAVKRETLHTHKNLRPNSDEFLKAVGERFTEVIVKTQVYDSTLSRSANMRSKSTWMNMVTSFLAEPTTSINMLQDSFRKGKRGKYTFRALGAVYGSVLLNSALVSIVYAMRDDDEDETFLEKYLSRFTTEVIDGVIPLTSIPLVKDVWSLLQGYDIERADMSLISDVVASLQQMVKLVSKDTSDMDEDELAEHRKAINEAVLKITDNLSSCFGVPLKNVRRDLNGIINAFKTIKKDVNERDTTAGSLGDNVLEDVKDSVPVWGWFPDESKGDKLYDAIVKGDTAYVDRLKGGYKTDTAYQSAVRKALRENDPRIKEAAEARYNGDIAEYMRVAKAIIAEGNFKQDDVVSAINAEISAMKKGEETTESASSDKVASIYKMEDYYDALAGRDQATAYVVKEDLIKTDVANGKDSEEAEEDFNSKFTSHLRERFEDGDISASDAERMLSSYGGKSEEDAANKVQYWEFKKEYPDYDLSEEAVTKYYNDVEPYGIGVSVYYDYSKQKAKCKGTDSNGDGKTDSGSVKKEVLAVIDSLPITYKQKDALYYLNGWAESTIREAPWH